MLFKCKTLPFLPYLKIIYIITILSKSEYIKVFILSGYINFRSNLTINASNICKKIMAKIIAQIHKS